MTKLIFAGVFLYCFLAPGCESEPTVISLSKYADKIEAQLKDKNQPYGYAFVVSRAGENSVSRAWGVARRSPDVPERAMSVDVKYTMASVSKNITAAAMLKLLDDTRQGSLDEKLDEKIVPYLPFNWQPGPGIASITFRELLTHRTGIRCDPDFTDYQSLKSCLAKGIVIDDKQRFCKEGGPIGQNKIGCYMNANYALFRVIIPVMLGKIKPLTKFEWPTTGPNGLLIAKIFDPAEAKIDEDNANLAAAVYINYVNDNVFARAGLPALSCGPTDVDQQGKAYKLSAPNKAGTDFGNAFKNCGSTGWFLSASQMSTYFQAVNFPGKIVSGPVIMQMRNGLLGYDGTSEISAPAGKVQEWFKYGGIPASMNPGEVNTLVLHFSNGIELAIIINSDMPASLNYGVAVNSAMSDLLNGI